MYKNFSFVYDSLMEDADYKVRAERLFSLFEKYDRMPKLMLDLACGTGAFSRRFSSKGVSVIGVDISEDMLAVAEKKSEGYDIMYLCQDMTELDLYGTVDGAICCLDSFNHLESYKDFVKTLKKVSLFLEPERLFIFDLNTPYKHKKVLGDNTFIKESGDAFCVWQNEYESHNNAVNITLDIFTKQGKSYNRATESFREIAFGDLSVKSALKRAGFRLVTQIDGETGDKLNSKSERIIYVARKVE